MTAGRSMPGAVDLLLCAILGASLGVAAAGDAAPAPVPASIPDPPPEPVALPPAASAACPDGCPGSPAGATGPAPAGAPTRVRIPRIRVDAALTRLRLDRSGRLGAPRDFAEAGWYAAGTAPGDVGPAVLAGHVDSTTGPAVFARLSELRPGDRIEVRRGGRWLGFRVTGAGRHAKDAFPTDAVYRPTPGPELRLITCAGAFDRSTRHYRDNLVVYAVADRPVVIPGPARAPGVRAGPVGSDGAPA
ncbi:class F sortase [Plantactinospora sp. BC1]|uniref:class F sortase n=1 Tax=Plantactinospora sp. BC1 TaxID=2108470 RepID=UPI001F32D6ED|nr:class F sortase [Plantactinospora sp. BC1]